MDVNDILALDNWIDTWMPPILEHYRPLRDVLANNAQQPVAQPVAQPLNELVEFLEFLKVEELSTLQMQVLQQLEIEHLLGRKGAYWIKRTIKSSNYDPATAHQKISEAVGKMEQAQANLRSFKSSAVPLGFELKSDGIPPDMYRIAVMFQDGASIENVPDLKSSSTNWEQIVGGVAEAVGERPEDTKIVGVSNGSILVFLGATATFTKVLAVIAKNASDIAGYAIDIANQLEDLRTKKMHNEAIENELRRMEKGRREKCAVDATNEVEKLLTEQLKPEQKTKLENSIKKYLAFREKGGDLDFSTPPQTVEDDENFNEEAAAIVNEVRELIEKAQRAKQNTLLLERKKMDQTEGEE